MTAWVIEKYVGVGWYPEAIYPRREMAERNIGDYFQLAYPLGKFRVVGYERRHEEEEEG